MIRFRLRTIFLTFLVASVVLAMYSLKVRRLRHQIEMTEGLGGIARLDVDCNTDGMPNGPFIDPATSYFAQLQRRLARISPFREIVAVELNGRDISDADLENLVELTRLIRLDIFHTNIGDEGLKHLIPLKRLRFLCVEGTRVSQAGIDELRNSIPLLRITSSDPQFDELIEMIESLGAGPIWTINEPIKKAPE